MRPVMLTIFAAALTACGSNTSAPLVFGTDPQTGAVRRAAVEEGSAALAGPSAPAATARPRTPVQSAALEPVSEIYLSKDGRPAAASPPVASGARYATVRQGDTVYAIGRRYDVAPQTIIALNKLRAPDEIAVGQRLMLPDAAGATPVARAEPQTIRQPAPVRAASAKPARQGGTYSVRPGDTLFSIAQSSGAEVETLAAANGLSAPYALSVGQTLKLPAGDAQKRASAPVATAAPAALAPTPVAARATAPTPQRVSYTSPASTKLFAWPVEGEVIARFGAGEFGRRNDGVNIAAPAGAPVKAAADGAVVYRGSELEGFGNLLLVKHQDGFVTAYAHNGEMLVDKGDRVRQGQKIATVGQTGAVTSPQLHFEIRQQLKSVDPLAFLNAD